MRERERDRESVCVREGERYLEHRGCMCLCVNKEEREEKKE